MATDLDDVDRGILHALQANAREVTAAEMAESVGVAASTVRNRIDRLETTDVIRGYRAEVDYERAGFPLHAIVVCRTPDGQPVPVEPILDLRGTVGVRQLLSSVADLHVEAVAADTAGVEAFADDLSDLGVEVVRIDLLTGYAARPFDGFAVSHENDHPDR